MGQNYSKSKKSVHPNRQEWRDPENNATGVEKDERSGNQEKQRQDMAGRNHHSSVRQNERKRESDGFHPERTPPRRDKVRGNHQDNLRQNALKREGFQDGFQPKKAPPEVRAKKLSSKLNCFSDEKNDESYSYHRSPSRTPNLDFYQNKMPFKPNGVDIKELLSKWKNDYKTLEKNHSYIQWLFPLREQGKNPSATPLTEEEIQMMRQDEDVRRRILDAYRLMLGFYGILLMDEKTGEVKKAENWEDRFHNLNSHSHNNLRITRILKCLGLMDYDDLQAPLVRFFLEETLCHNNLPNVKKSALNFFVDTVKDEEERKKLDSMVNYYCRPQKDKITSNSNKNGTKSERRQNGSQSKASRKDSLQPFGLSRNPSRPLPVTPV